MLIAQACARGRGEEKKPSPIHPQGVDVTIKSCANDWQGQGNQILAFLDVEAGPERQWCGGMTPSVDYWDDDDDDFIFHGSACFE